MPTTATNIAVAAAEDYLNRCASAGSEISGNTPNGYDMATTFNGSTQYLSVASNSTLTVTGSSFSFAFWINPSASSTYCLIGKTSAGDTREFQIFCNSGSISFAVFPDGTFANKKEVTSAVVALNTWTFVTCVYDSGTGTISVYLNAGTPASVSSVPAITQTNANPFQIAVFTSSLYYFNGKIAAVSFWKRALLSTEITSLYNNGLGLNYPQIQAAGLTTNLVSYWALNETTTAASATRADSVGTNTLTSSSAGLTASVTGPIVTGYTSSRSLIVDFCKGIYDLGLWNSMVCWPLRSSQNPSGAIAYSLGGLGRYDGAISGGAATGSSGMVFTNGGRIGFSNFDIASGSYFSVANPSWGTITTYSDASLEFTSYPSGQSNAIKCRKYVIAGAPNAGGNAGKNFGLNLVDYTSGTGFGFSGQSEYSSLTQGQNTFETVTCSGTTYNGYKNGGKLTSIFAGSSKDYDQLPYFSATRLTELKAYMVNSAATANIALPILGYSTSALTDSQQSSLYSLYKNTLGVGLGLP